MWLFSRFLRTYGVLGLEHGLQQAVDSALDNNWRRDPLDRRQRGGCSWGKRTLIDYRTSGCNPHGGETNP
eukprot:4421398-Pyramimonas_sp.AAC.1